MAEDKKKEIAVIEITEEYMKDRLYEFRGKKVMLDSDLAEIYGYETKNFKRQVKNNIAKFEGDDFMFELNDEEVENLSRCKNFTLNMGRGSNIKYKPYVFTEQGVYMLMTVLRGELAIKQSRALVKTFKKMKDYILENRDLIGQREILQLSMETANNRIEINKINSDMISLEKQISDVAEGLKNVVTKSELADMMNSFVSDDDEKWLMYNAKFSSADEVYESIYKQAKSSIYVVDNYIGLRTLVHLKNSPTGVNITLFSDNVGNNKLHNIEFTDFCKEYPSVKISMKKTGGIFHDRFIVLDYGTADERVFLCGASSKDHIVENGSYDVIIVDEAHKLSRKYGKQHPSFGQVYKIPGFEDCNSHLEILQRMGQQIILMYDVLQAIRPANVTREMFKQLTAGYEKKFLHTQFRIQTPKGKSYTSDDYVNGIKYLLFKDTGLLDSELTNFDPDFNRDVFRDKSEDAYFGYVLGKPMHQLIDWIEKDRNFNAEHINRVLSGMFCCATADKWSIAHGKDPSITHFHEDGLHRRWNSTQENWINIGDTDAEDQIGSVFAVQGIDLNKVGVMIGPDIRVNEDGILEAVPDNHNNTNNKFSTEEMQDTANQFEFTLYILNQYYVLLTRGIDGIRLGFWNGDNSFRKYMEETLEIH